MGENTSTKDDILAYIRDNEPVTAHMISDFFKIHPTMTHRHLKYLQSKNCIKKKGRPPKVYYFINQTPHLDKPIVNLPSHLHQLLDDHYYQRSPDGKELYGAQGFATWCAINGLDTAAKATEFADRHDKIEAMKTKGRIDMTPDFVKTFGDTELTHVWHADFFSIPVFERTKLGNLVLYGKQTSDKAMIEDVAAHIEPTLKAIIEDFAIDHIGLIPHTDTTKPLLFLPTLRGCMNLRVNQLSFIKLFYDKPLPQKTLKKLNDRITNAQETIYLQKTSVPAQNILLIDDAASSGATLQVTSQKIKKQYPDARVYGFVIISSRAWYEVITEI